MGSAIFQAMKLGITILLIAFLFVFGVMMFHAMQYTQFANQSRRLLQESDRIPPNTQIYKDYQPYKVLQNNTKKPLPLYHYTTHYGSKTDIKALKKDWHNYWIARENHKPAYYSNSVRTYSVGRQLNRLEEAYGYMFTLNPYKKYNPQDSNTYKVVKNNGQYITEPKLLSSPTKTYGQQIKYYIQIRVPYNDFFDPSNANVNGHRVLNLSRFQAVDSILTNDNDINNSNQ